MNELGAADLAFTEEEAGAFLRGVMGLELSEGDVATLEERTEGWIAGLQLAGALYAGSQRRLRLHRILLGQPPRRPGLPGRGGSRTPAPSRTRISACDLHPRTISQALCATISPATPMGR